MRLLRLAGSNAEQLAALRDEIGHEEFSYRPGLLGGSPPDGMVRDVLEVSLGDGAEVWKRARAALTAWTHFDLAWVGIETGGEPPSPGLDVVVYASRFMVQLTVACRVVQTHDEEQDGRARFGFTYGSLRSHVERGEELFEVTKEPSGRVAYRIDVVAQPAHWYAVIAKPIVDRLRNRFREDSAAAMRRAVIG